MSWRQVFPKAQDDRCALGFVESQDGFDYPLMELNPLDDLHGRRQALGARSCMLPRSPSSLLATQPQRKVIANTSQPRRSSVTIGRSMLQCCEPGILLDVLRIVLIA